MLTFYTNTPRKLLAAIKTAIDEGHVRTWRYDRDGDFTHAETQWERKAWMCPSVVEGSALRFGILFASGVTNTREVYAIYHGRFTEMMLAHFDGQFDGATASALLDSGVDFGSGMRQTG